MIDIIQLLGLVGLTLIVTRGSIFSAVRRLAPHFLSCPQCVGWHVGFWITYVQAVTSHPPELWFFLGALFHAVLLGGAVSLLSSLSEAAIEALDEVILKFRDAAGWVKP